MKFGRPFDFTKDRRQYPIQRDLTGQSLRQRCFYLFRQGKKAREVAVILRMKLTTTHRYYSQWNGCPPALEETYKFIKQDLKKKGELSPRVISMIGTALGIPEWEVFNMISRPHGLKQLIKGEFVLQRKKLSYNTQEQRLEAALNLVILYEHYGIPMEWIYREVKKLMQRAIKYKEKSSVDPSRNMDKDNNLTGD